MISRDHRAGARHVLHDESRIARYMSAHEARVSAGILIVIVAWLIADDNSDGFALIKIRLRECLFQVQGIQEFKGQNGNESEKLERLNS
jgi:hypothetical protein